MQRKLTQHTMHVAVRRLLLDAFKPRESSIIELSKAICSTEGAEEVDIIVSEVDSKTETIKVTVTSSPRYRRGLPASTITFWNLRRREFPTVRRYCVSVPISVRLYMIPSRELSCISRP
ncbi:MAG TPA: DUF211 domain-containing protein, partial [Candidatus Methanoperedens sp.]|nr:DUF211 domain-containing protein [Candidatus Methanoperedens sp.]